MKQFGLLIFIFALVAILSSCSSTYLYSTLDSANDGAKKTTQGDFFYENDSLWISYSIKGVGSPLLITIYNKLDKPIIIDWEKSFIVYNGIKHTYRRGIIVYTGDSTGKSFINPTQIDQSTAIRLLNTPPNLSFIPQYKMVTHRTFDLRVDLEEFRTRKMTSINVKRENHKGEKIDALLFDFSASPLQISSYINVSYDSIDSETTYAMDFYMANVLRTHRKPKKMPFDVVNRGDMIIYQRKPTYRFWKNLGKGAALTGIAVTALTVDSYLSQDGE